MRVSPIELMTANGNQQSYNCLYEQQRASLQAKPTGQQGRLISSPPHMPSIRRKPSEQATEKLKSKPRISTQAKLISPFLASTTKLRGGHFPLIGQGNALCLRGLSPQQWVREGIET